MGPRARCLRACASELMMIIVHHHIRAVAHGGGSAISDFLLSQVTHKLDLTEAQEERIDSIIFHMHNDFMNLLSESRPRVQDILEHRFGQIEAELTAEQRVEFAKIRHRFERHLSRGLVPHGDTE